MSPADRIQHIKSIGLTAEEKDELLKINRLVCSLLQQDAYQKGIKQRDLKRKKLVRTQHTHG